MAAAGPTLQEIREEDRRVRRLQLVARLCFEALSAADIGFDEAAELMSDFRRVALDLFPGKEQTFEIIYGRRLRRFIELRFGRLWM